MTTKRPKDADPQDRDSVRQPDEESTEAKGMDRRTLLKVLGVAGATAVGMGRLEAAVSGDDEDPVGLLIDTTRCVGCQSCDYACAEANGLPAPEGEDAEPYAGKKTSETRWTALNVYETDIGEVYVKKQCMHCLQPACASACLTKAMLKTDEGPVIWRGDRCMGCRFCMVSCPFDIPKFEYHSAFPKIHKCRLCYERLLEGQKPACVENCPAEAIMFGRRTALLEEGKRRIYQNPDQYVHQIYGEHEVGGTSALYLAAVPFEQLGFRTDLGVTSYPKLTEDFLYGVPIVLTVLPALLLGVRTATQPNGEKTENGAQDDDQ
jgi:Fe-S-cluster-containing dehydrogenase component